MALKKMCDFSNHIAWLFLVFYLARSRIGMTGASGTVRGVTAGQQREVLGTNSIMCWSVSTSREKTLAPIPHHHALHMGPTRRGGPPPDLPNYSNSQLSLGPLSHPTNNTSSLLPSQATKYHFLSLAPHS